MHRGNEQERHRPSIEDTDLDASGPINFQRPIRIDSQSRIKSSRWRIISQPPQKSYSTVCIRSIHTIQRPALSDTARHVNLGAYIVVGILNSTNGRTIERIEELRDSEQRPRDALEAIRHAAKYLRPLFFRRLFSLKTVGGFGLYECHPHEGYHTEVETSDGTDHTLSELFQDYASGRRDTQDMWKTWIHTNFNRGDNFPGSRRLALRLLLQWSGRKILAFTFIPILLSIAIGFGYMYWEHDPESGPATITQTAWTISSYVVTTAGGNSV